MLEIWKDIPGYEGLYQASSFGRVKSLYTGEIKKPTLAKVGYYVMTLSKSKNKKVEYVHLLILLAFKGPAPIGLIGDHKNNIKTDNLPSNLQYVTRRVNNTKDRKPSVSRFIGVSWDKHRAKWFSQIAINGNRKFLGRFDSEEDAGDAYKKALDEWPS